MTTVEAGIEGIVRHLSQQAYLPPDGVVDWGKFSALSDTVHRNFEVPATAISPVMRRLLFSLGAIAKPKVLVGAGTYVGYAFSWLVGGARSAMQHGACVRSIALDCNPESNRIAQNNFKSLPDLKVEFHTAYAEDFVAEVQDIELLYLDVDDPINRKRGYKTIVERALSRIRPGALLLAHDATEVSFAEDLRSFHSYLESTGCFSVPKILPVDRCGLSITRRIN